jgi:hypothetical protein
MRSHISHIDDLIGAGAWSEQTVDPRLLSRAAFPLHPPGPGPGHVALPYENTYYHPATDSLRSYHPPGDASDALISPSNQQYMGYANQWAAAPKPAQMMNSPTPFASQRTWAEVADLPFQRKATGPSSSSPNIASNIGASYPPQTHSVPSNPIRPTSPIARVPSPGPVFRLDMRQKTPPNFFDPLDDFMLNDDVEGPSPAEALMAGWLREPMTVDDRAALRLNVVLTPMPPRHLLSPARSVAGTSDRSTGRRSRKDRQTSRCAHRCPDCNEGFHTAENLKSVLPF